MSKLPYISFLYREVEELFETPRRKLFFLAIYSIVVFQAYLVAMFVLTAFQNHAYSMDKNSQTPILASNWSETGSVLQAGANTYYISPSGSDSNNGSINAPWKTFAKANAVVGNGDTVKVKDGTYNEVVRITKQNTKWLSENPYKAIIDGQKRMPGGGDYAALVHITGPGVLFEGFTVINSDGVGIQPFASNIIVRNNRIDWTYRWAIRMTPPPNANASNVLVERNIISRTNQIGRRGGAAINTTRNIDRPIIRNNIIGFCNGEGIVVNDGTLNAVIEGNTIHHCYIVAIYNENGINTVIRNNAVFHFDTPEFPMSGSGGILHALETENNRTYDNSGGQVYNNIVYNMNYAFHLKNNERTNTRVDGLYVGYNTFVSGANSANSVILRGPNQGNHENSLFENNLILSSKPAVTSGNITGIAFRNNAWSLVPPSRLRSFSDRYGNPNLRNPNAEIKLIGTFPDPRTNFDPRNYLPTDQSTSIINKASNGSSINGLTPPNITVDFSNFSRGNEPEIGALELGSPGTMPVEFPPVDIPNNQDPLPDPLNYCIEPPKFPPIYCGLEDDPIVPPGPPPGCGALSDMGMVDITCPQYGADPTCSRDSTSAIQRAVNDAFKNDMAVFFPEGTYCISDTIFAVKANKNDYRSTGHEFIGSTRGARPILRLKPNSPGFNTQSNVKPVINMYYVCSKSEGCGGSGQHEFGNPNSANGFVQSIRNIDIEIEEGNDGAVGVRFRGAQGNSLENVSVRMKSGYAGFGNMVGTWSAIDNLQVDGGKYGIVGRLPAADGFNDVKWPSFTNVRLYNQSIAAIAELAPTTWTFSGLHIKKQSGPAIIAPRGGGSNAGGSINIIDGVIELEGGNTEAIDNSANQSITLLNTYFNNAAVMSKSPSHTLQGGSGWRKISEYGYASRFDNRGVLVLNGNQTTNTHIGTITVETPSPSVYLRHSFGASNDPSPDVILSRIAAGDTKYANVWDHGIFPTKTGFANIGSRGGYNISPDVTQKLQALIDSGVEKIFFPKGKYIISNTIQMRDSTHFIGIANQFSGLMVSDQWQPTQRPTFMVVTPDSATASPKMSHFRLTWPTEKQRDFFGAVHWRSGKIKVNDVAFRPVWGAGSNANYVDQYPNIRHLFTGNAGGVFWGLGVGSNENRNQHPGYRHVLIDGTSNSLTIYGINPEDHNFFGSTDGWGVEIKNAKNIALLGSKQENHNTLRIDNSENIILLGIANYDNTTLTNVNNAVGSFHPKKYDGQAMFNEVYDGRRVSVSKNKELGIFKRGQADSERIFSGRTIDDTVNPPSPPVPPIADITCAGGVAPGLSTQPCSVYKEFKLLNRWNNRDWRVTGEDAAATDAQKFLPNPVLNLAIDDLEHAIRAEVVLDMWGGHDGTQQKRIRMNGNEWVSVPAPRFDLPADNPGTRANEADPMWYYYEMNPHIEIPLAHLKEGINTLEGNANRCGNGTCVGWPQWGMIGVIVRVFYDPAVKTGPAAAITYPLSNAMISEYSSINVAGTSDVGVERIDIIGNYYGYDENGDGFYTDWHQGYFVKNVQDKDPNLLDISGHIGTVMSSIGTVRWDTTWVPDQQEKAISFIARVKDRNGYWSVSTPVTGISLYRSQPTVQLFEPDKASIRPAFGVRAGQTKTSTVTIPAGVNIADVSEARIHFRTWNGIRHNSASDPHGTFSLNGSFTANIGGQNHHYAYTTPEILNASTVLKTGENRVSVSSATIHHANEILWPGPAISVRYGEELLCPPLTPIPWIHLDPEPTEFRDILTGFIISPIVRNDNQIFFNMGSPSMSGDSAALAGLNEIRVYLDGEVEDDLFEQNAGNRIWVRGRVEEGENLSGEYEKYAVSGPQDVSFERMKGTGFLGGAVEVNWSVILPMSLVILVIAGTGVMISRRF